MNKLLLICAFLLLAACQQKEAETTADSASEQNAAEVAEAADEAAAPAVVPDTAEAKEIVAKLGSDNCFLEFKEYMTYKHNAAFSTSTDGACGWSSESLKTEDEAKKEAVASCEDYRDTGEACKVVNVNGKWQS